MAGVSPELDVNPYPAAVPSAGHHGMPPQQSICKEAQQNQASELTHEKSTSLEIHLLEN